MPMTDDEVNVRRAIAGILQAAALHRIASPETTEAVDKAVALFSALKSRPAPSSVPSREAGPGTPIKRCNKPVNDGRHLCRFPDGHEGECGAHVNAPAAPLASLGERPDDDVRRAIAGILQAAALHAIASPETTAAVDKAVAMYAALRSSLQEARADSERAEVATNELWDERTRLRDALFTIQHEVRSVRHWSDVCESAMARALLPLSIGAGAPLVERER